MILFERSSLARACTNLSPYSHSFSLERKMSNARAAIEHSQARRSLKNQQSVRNDSHVTRTAGCSFAVCFHILACASDILAAREHTHKIR